MATLSLRARLSISEMHLVMMKGTPSLATPATWEKSRPNSCRRPWSFLWPHWMASVSRQRLWHARKHCGPIGERPYKDYRHMAGNSLLPLRSFIVANPSLAAASYEVVVAAAASTATMAGYFYSSLYFDTTKYRLVKISITCVITYIFFFCL